jgi:hypothetical protein
MKIWPIIKRERTSAARSSGTASPVAVQRAGTPEENDGASQDHYIREDTASGAVVDPGVDSRIGDRREYPTAPEYRAPKGECLSNVAIRHEQPGPVPKRPDSPRNEAGRPLPGDDVGPPPQISPHGRSASTHP